MPAVATSRITNPEDKKKKKKLPAQFKRAAKKIATKGRRRRAANPARSDMMAGAGAVIAMLAGVAVTRKIGDAFASWIAKMGWSTKIAGGAQIAAAGGGLLLLIAYRSKLPPKLQLPAIAFGAAALSAVAARGMEELAGTSTSAPAPAPTAAGYGYAGEVIPALPFNPSFQNPPTFPGAFNRSAAGIQATASLGAMRH